ncbi:lycopene cyclase family protein [Polaribacter tangerinus]|uniref:lycopene cyclase family protein n=1 Tax=Polaribacter tangerinus TaxID=1920034 RepID=UPI000B4AC077|nr:lycopene cyclase family protein [Polaribacter tangerinus]
MKYDYIIAGAGCAGLSLLYNILKSPLLRDKKILVVDKDAKTNNDRTWCYWEKKPGIFEDIVHAKWQHLEFLSTDYSEIINLGNYTYKMILGIDFYKYVFGFAKNFKNVTFLQETITNISGNLEGGIISTDKGKYSGNFIFNSTTLYHPKINKKNSLLQHFKGWVIQTEENCFNSKIGTLMDFRVSQKNGATFMYVLPISKKEALVEYTLFSREVLEKETYSVALKKYIKEVLKITNYKISHEEFGVIPMSLAKFKKHPEKNIINIGTAGGFTKASSGYTFQFIQKDATNIVSELEKNNTPIYKKSFRDATYSWYDATLLDVLLSEKMSGKEVFTKIFKKNNSEKVMAFLANESTFLDDISIMSSMPMYTFSKAAIKQLLL